MIAESYSADIGTRLAPITDSIEGQEKRESVDQVWEKVVHAFSETSEDVLGLAKNKPAQEWLSETTWKLVEECKILRASRGDNECNRKHYN